MKFSVLMSVYSGEKPEFLRSCLQSLECQTLLASEVIIVEDGTLSEELAGIIESYRMALNILSIKLPINKGLGNALNIGLKHCSYPLVARMDTDDISLPTRFEKQVNFFKKHPNVGVLGTAAVTINNENNIYGQKKLLPEANNDIVRSLWSCPIIHPSVMYKKSLIEDVGSYSLTLKRRQDYDLWFKCAINKVIFHNLPEALIQYRVLESSYKKNSFSVSLDQAIIGLRGVYTLKLGFIAYLGVCFPLFKAILPNGVRSSLIKWVSRFDPRVGNK